MQWKHLSSPCPYKFVSQPSAGKTMPTTFFIINELLMVFKNSAITITKQCYCGTLTDLCTTKRKCLAKQMRSVIMWLTLSSKCCALWTIPHTVHTLFGSLKEALIGHWFRAEKDIVAVVLQWLQQQTRELSWEEIHLLVCQWDACLSTHWACF
jgi:hypothetical protein